MSRRAWWAPLACAPIARARSTEDGDFAPPLPDVGRIDDNVATDDAYAEVAAYRGIEHFFTTLESRGLSSRRCAQFTVVINDHRAGEDGQLVSNNNASYVDTCNPDVAPQVVLGQGTDADYAWDVDVLYHELGHSVVQDLTAAGLLQRRDAPWGIASEAGVINEGIVDYFAMSVSDDPNVGEYVGRTTVASGSPYLRSGENTAVFPDDMIGDWHSDSRVVSAALWAVRRRIGLVVAPTTRPRSPCSSPRARAPTKSRRGPASWSSTRTSGGGELLRGREQTDDGRVKVESRMPCEPALHRWRLVRGEVVQDDVYFEIRLHVAIDSPKEVDEVLGARSLTSSHVEPTRQCSTREVCVIATPRTAARRRARPRAVVPARVELVVRRRVHDAVVVAGQRQRHWPIRSRQNP